MFQISIKLLIIVGALIFFNGCSSGSGIGTYSSGADSRAINRYKQQSDSHRQAVHRATFRPYSVYGIQYCPHTVREGQVMEGVASWYGSKFHGKKSSSGEVYNMHELTAAHKTWPMHTVVRVDNVDNGRSVVVRINDRGPFLSDRVIDLSYEAARRIDMHNRGLANVKITVLSTDSKNWPSDAPSGHSTGATRDECGSVSTADTGAHQVSPPQGASSGDVYVQIGSFGSLEAAQRFKNRSLNIPPKFSAHVVSSDDLHRVLLSGFDDEADARLFIERSKFGGAFLVRER